MTDFRRPDLDPWEEEDEAEDARPTIVAQRPTPHTGSAREQTIPFATPLSERKTPDIGRSALVQRLIEQGALEDEAQNQGVEELRDSEIDVLRLPPEPELPALPMSALVPRAKLGAHAGPLASTHGIESEPATEDPVPTVSVKRPLPPMSGQLGFPKLTTAPPRRTDRDVTERISIPSGMVGSIAPATRTSRPREQDRRGLPWWQTALAAVALVGGGLSIAKFRAERGGERTTTSVSLPNLGSRAQPRSAPAPEPAHLVAAPPQTEISPAPQAPPEQREQPAEPIVAAGPPPPPAPTVFKPQPQTTAPPALKADSAVRPAQLRSRAEPRASLGSRAELRASTRPEQVALADEENAARSQPVRADAKPASDSLPATPTREQVTASLNGVLPELQKCVGDLHGTADVTVTVRSAGLVSYAVVSGAYAGTSEGSCIARAVKTAKFPAFSDQSLRVTYPFQL